MKDMREEFNNHYVPGKNRYQVAGTLIEDTPFFDNIMKRLDVDEKITQNPVWYFDHKFGITYDLYLNNEYLNQMIDVHMVKDYRV